MKVIIVPIPHKNTEKAGIRHTFWQLLSEDERKKEASFVFEKDQWKFCFCRGFLRVLIGHYLNIQPKAIVFKYSAFGKPFLSETQGLHFNLSHSKSYLAIAFSKNNVGVDIEEKREIDIPSIVSHLFTEEEKKVFNLFNEEEKISKFYEWWTKKEALLKGLGWGFGKGVNPFSISNSFKKEATVEGTNWILLNLKAPKDHTLAIAYEGKTRKRIIVHNKPWLEIETLNNFLFSHRSFAQHHNSKSDFQEKNESQRSF